MGLGDEADVQISTVDRSRGPVCAVSSSRGIEHRINTGTMDFTEVQCPPSSMWEDFDMLYYDPEVGLENPVDVKVNKVGHGLK